jgi:hypothetical protein
MVAAVLDSPRLLYWTGRARDMISTLQARLSPESRNHPTLVARRSARCSPTCADTDAVGPPAPPVSSNCTVGATTTPTPFDCTALANSIVSNAGAIKCTGSCTAAQCCTTPPQGGTPPPPPAKLEFHSSTELPGAVNVDDFKSGLLSTLQNDIGTASAVIAVTKFEQKASAATTMPGTGHC